MLGHHSVGSWGQSGSPSSLLPGDKTSMEAFENHWHAGALDSGCWRNIIGPKCCSQPASSPCTWAAAVQGCCEPLLRVMVTPWRTPLPTQHRGAHPPCSTQYHPLSQLSASEEAQLFWAYFSLFRMIINCVPPWVPWAEGLHPAFPRISINDTPSTFYTLVMALLPFLSSHQPDYFKAWRSFLPKVSPSSLLGPHWRCP